MNPNTLDVVYTVKQQASNEELRYSLRSLKNIPHNNVWIVGYKPNWARTNYIFSRTISRNKIANTNRNWLIAALNSKISDPFILMNDDFFINRPISLIEPTYLCDNIEFQFYYRTNYPRSYYTKVINDTSNRLIGLGIKTAKCYELHDPMVVYKTDIIKALSNYNYITTPINLRTVVANIGAYGGKKVKDVKVYGTEKEKHRSLKNYKSSKFISTDDIAFSQCEVGRYIREKFNEKSEYEL